MDTHGCKKRELKMEEGDISASKKIKLEPTDEGDTTLLAEPSSPSNDGSVKGEVKDEDKEPEFFTTSMYTDEFTTMLDTVLNGEQFLFDADELQVFEQFQLLQDESKHLLVRLLMRKQKWLRMSKFNYARNVRDLDKTAADLEAHGFAETTLHDLSEALAILSKDELKAIVKERSMQNSIDSSARKGDFAKEILQFATTTSIIPEFDAAKMEDLWTSIRQHLGSCIRVDPARRALFERVQIVYYRINLLDDTNPMSNAILAKTSKRAYPEYTACRSNSIWHCRADLLRYEQALQTEKAFYQMTEGLKVFNTSRTKRVISAEGGDAAVRQKMIEAWTICENSIGIWEDCINEAQERPYYMRRFEAGWIYTRLMDHGTELLAKMHEYELEVLILHKLLAQYLYRLGKRGKWYDRLALVQTIHIKSDNPRLQKKAALQTCIDAIHDSRVHQIYLHDIHKRITKLEKDLCVPRREQHDFSYMNLKKPKEITIHGERISEEIIGKKSVWRSDNGAECSVEQVALEYYQKKGFKGLHCENGVIRMIMVLLFWDIIFAPIPGVFETPYQSEPLDLRTDAFYESRQDLINARIREIEDGAYVEIIKQVDKRERPRNTACIGINWKYEPQDILEIAECIGSVSLASLSKLFFEEFGQRQGGMPDLCCWNYEKKQCLFSEVKGPKDKLSKTQQVWIETLTGFGIDVEVCHVQIWKGEDIFLQEDA
ncbi:VRR-NUC domain-containing protein [Mucor lusitanicus]|uniref:Fanconi-associated nuclease n=1 Tax=Mucor circinelloides f. lusitanicus TaxID=29924 RepID=A0A8H4BDB8_MUCCL|nr:VRR-NUC domain-containing protein [Mucor lusitanicus]